MTTNLAAEMVDPASLKPWPKNPRKNDGEPVAKVADSIRRFGFAAPIVARLETREIIAGHTRWKAAQQLKLTEIPVRFLDLSEREAHLLALADNRLGELAEWDTPELHRLLASYDIGDQLLAGFEKASAPPEIDVGAHKRRPPDPTLEQLESAEFQAVWQVIKGWKVDHGNGRRTAATGNDVAAILNAIAATKG